MFLLEMPGGANLQLFLIELILVKFVFTNITCAWQCLEFHFSLEFCSLFSSIFINVNVILFFYTHFMCKSTSTAYIIILNISYLWTPQSNNVLMGYNEQNFSQWPNRGNWLRCVSSIVIWIQLTWHRIT